MFLKEARRLGFEVWGIDFDRKSIKIAKEKFGLENVFSMSLEEFVEFCKRENLRFDIITFFEVLEHQDNPKEFLHQVKSILKPGGYIAGSVPNSEAIKGLLYYSPVNLPPHHFLWFTKRALVNLFNTCFEIDKIEIYNVKFSSFIKNLNELSAYISFFLGRKAFLTLREDLKKATIGKSYYTSSSRKLMFKLLKGVRNGIFMPLALIAYPFLKGFHFYFQFQVKS